MDEKREYFGFKPASDEQKEELNPVNRKLNDGADG